MAVDAPAHASAQAFDVVIVGGGPAGLSAALILGRCRRRVAVLDMAEPRNRHVRAAHGFLTRDGSAPGEILRLAREQLEPYDVELHEGEVVRVRRDDESGTWEAVTATGQMFRSKKLVLATGVRDRLPSAPGFEELFGRGVFVCPYCDGWEQRDRRLGAYVREPGAADFALSLLTWSSDVVAFSDGETFSPEDRGRLERNGVAIEEGRVVGLAHEGDRIEGVRLASGEVVACEAVFVHMGQDQAAPFALQLGCPTVPNGSVCVGEGERAGPSGLYVAGDASQDVQLVAVAVAEGVKAACAINAELRKERHR